MTATLDRLDRIAVTFKFIQPRVRLSKPLRLPTDLTCEESAKLTTARELRKTLQIHLVIDILCSPAWILITMTACHLSACFAELCYV